MSPNLPTPAGHSAISAGDVLTGGPAAPRLDAVESGRREPLRTSRADNQSAARLISETAHDLRAPLATIRESVRLVRDGELGSINASMRDCLTAAIDQCNCTSQMVDEMVQAHHVDGAFPGARRIWLPIDDVKKSVEATMAPWTLPRGIQLLWDGPFGHGIRTYADPVLLRRLIVNLLGNAVRVTRDGQSILMRAKANGAEGTITWSIVDQGRGIEASDMELIVAGKMPSRSSGGLGLLISRQLAAAHFSRLRIESRVGTGTAVSFRTPTGGPIAAAGRWVRWRCGLASPADAVASVEPQQIRNVYPRHAAARTDGIATPRRVRIDVPSQTIELGVPDLHPAFPECGYVTKMTVGAAVSLEAADHFGRLLDRSMRMTEWAYRTGRRSWLIVWDADTDIGAAKRADLERTIHRELDTVRMRWGAPLTLPIDLASPQRTARRLADLIINESSDRSVVNRWIPSARRVPVTWRRVATVRFSDASAATTF